MSNRAGRLISALGSARKAVQLYPPSHPRHVEALLELEESVRDCAAAGENVVNLYQGRLYSGSDVISADIPGAVSIAEALEARRVESLTFEGGFDQNDALGLIEALAIRPSPDLDVERELSDRGVAHVGVAFLVDTTKEEREERNRRREQDRALYKQVVSALKAIRQRLAQGQQIALDQAGAVAQGVLGRLLEDKGAALGLATLSSKGESNLFHAVNVMIYTLTLGESLGIPEEGLMSLGISALLHDIGKATFDPAEEIDSATVRLLHPQRGAEVLSQLIDEDTSPMTVAYEHHMRPDGLGFPEHPVGYVPHPFARMVAIADTYENLTKGTDDQRAITPDKAIASMLSDAGRGLDPLFTRLFIQAMGVFPVGCLVRLADQSVAVVCDVGADPLKPKVRVVYAPDGTELEDPIDIDLGTDDRDIVEVVDPEILKLDISDHL
jgi:HD-GYP domain-containing protein (c-di-GMP phosphodiesterase class II)